MLTAILFGLGIVAGTIVLVVVLVLIFGQPNGWK
jgi:hypothetical protein